jgi:glucose/arabinose dehydrogenase
MRALVAAVVVVVILVLVGVIVTQSARSSIPSEIGTSTAATTTTSNTEHLPVALKPVQISFSNGKNITLQIPQEYSLSVAAEGYRHLRFMSWSPDGRLFVGEMASASDDSTGRVVFFDDFDSATGRFKTAHVYLDRLRNPNSVAFYTDHSGVEWIYVALTDKLIRYQYTNGDLAPTSEPQILATFPDSGPPASQGGWHLTRTLAFNGDELFVSVGSGCNSCEEENIQRADIEVMNPDGTNRRVYASGLRNAVGIIYADGALYGTANEADHLGNDRPNDLVYKFEDGKNYGWPYCYEFSGKIYADATTIWKHPVDCSVVPLAWAELPPHSAPLGLRYFDNSFADSRLQNGILVAMHGSGKPSIATGYSVAIVHKDTAPIDFLSGFLQNGTRVGRPVDILQKDDESFFVTDDLNGALYYLRYTP